MRLGGNPWISAGGPLVGLALGMAAVVAPLTATVMGAAPPDRAGAASGINNAAARVAGLLAVILTTALTAFVFQAQLAGALESMPDPAAQASILAGAGRFLETPLPPGLGTESVQRVQSALRDSFAAAFATAMLMNAGLAGLAAVLCAFLPLRRGDRRGDRNVSL